MTILDVLPGHIFITLQNGNIGTFGVYISTPKVLYISVQSGITFVAVVPAGGRREYPCDNGLIAAEGKHLPRVELETRNKL